MVKVYTNKNLKFKKCVKGGNINPISNKIERWCLMTSTKYVQGPFWACKINTQKFRFKGRLHGTHSKSKHTGPNRVKERYILEANEKFQKRMYYMFKKN